MDDLRKAEEGRGDKFSTLDEMGQGSSAQAPVKRASSAWFSNESYKGSIDGRQEFLMKVYAILSAQLLCTVFICALCMYSDSTRKYMLKYPLANMLGFGLTAFVVMIILLISPGLKTTFPANVGVLALFTILESFFIGVLCASYYEAGSGELIMAAFIITVGVFVGLTVFAMQSKIDFSFLGGFLLSALTALIFWGFVNWIFGWRAGFAYSLCGAIIFSLYVLYDTHMICNRLGYDDYIAAALDLYLDFLNLFLYILSLLKRD
jgi:FtsH-binding integral membrane protein